MNRQEVIQQLSVTIHSFAPGHPTRVAIDGLDAAGKTTMADELAERLRRMDRTVIRSSIDNFHHPQAVRYRRGPLSPEGYFLDSFDQGAVISSLLLPFGPGGSLRYRIASFDHLADRPVVSPEQIAPQDAILLFDGIFLLQPAFLTYWDFSIYLHVTARVALQRALQRDSAILGGPEQVRARYRKRYFPAHDRYREACHPRQAASVVLDNQDTDRPQLISGAI